MSRIDFIKEKAAKAEEERKKRNQELAKKGYPKKSDAKWEPIEQPNVPEVTNRFDKNDPFDRLKTAFGYTDKIKIVNETRGIESTINVAPYVKAKEYEELEKAISNTIDNAIPDKKDSQYEKISFVIIPKSKKPMSDQALNNLAKSFRTSFNEIGYLSKAKNKVQDFKITKARNLTEYKTKIRPKLLYNKPAENELKAKVWDKIQQSRPELLAAIAVHSDKKWSEKQMEEIKRKNPDISNAELAAKFGKIVKNRFSNPDVVLKLKKGLDRNFVGNVALTDTTLANRWNALMKFRHKGQLEEGQIKTSLAKVINSVNKKVYNRKLKPLISKKGTKKLLNYLSSQNKGLENSEVLFRYLSTPEGVKAAQEAIIALKRSGTLNDNDIKTIQNNLPMIPIPYKELEYHKRVQTIANSLGKKATINSKKALAEIFYGKPGNYHQILPSKLFPYLQDDEFRKKAEEYTKRGDYDSLREYIRNRIQGKTFDYNELQKILGTEKIRQDVLDKLDNAGIKVIGEPRPIDVSGIKANIKSERMNLIKGGGIFSRPSSGGGRPVYRSTKSGLIFGSPGVSWSPSGPHLRETAGKLSATNISHYFGKRSKSRRAARRLVEYQTKGFNKVLSPEEQKITANASFPVRLYKEYKAKKMLVNPAFRKKVLLSKMEKEKKKDIEAAVKLREYQNKMRATSSPFAAAWFGISRKTKIILGALIAIAVLFLPVGLFYVAGWALAAGLAFLVALVIWVFMEMWNMLTQGIVAFINMIAQGVIGVINYVGSTITGYLGYTFTPFHFSLAESMQIQIGEGSGMAWGTWNLVPPSFMRLEHFMPTTFDTDTIIAKIYPPIAGLFHIIYGPIANRYIAWIHHAPWYYIGAIIGVPLLIAIVGIVLFVRYLGKKWRGM